MHNLTRREFGALTLGAAAVRLQDVGATQAAPVTQLRNVEDVASLTLAEASARIRARTVTPSQLVQACLARTDIYDRKVNAFITVMRDQALAQARELDAEQSAGRFRGPLHGIPLALKDNIDTAGTRTTAASAVFDERVPTADAEVARRLKAAGAIVIGKTNMHEFAAGITSATSYYGPVRNPWALDRNPGGSSGGSAAAVSADLCFGALGTDTGGSIRVPAAFCGLVGLKPTYGLVSIRGIVPLTLSLDHCGPIAKSVDDAAILLNALAGYDRSDIASVEYAQEDYLAAMRQPVSALRLGIPRAPFFDLLDPDVAKAVEAAIGVLGGMTRSVRDVTLPPVAADLTLPAEAYAYHEDLITSAPGRYMIPLRRTLQGRANLRASDYVRAKWRLDLLRRAIDDSFTDVDLVVLPTRRRTPRTVDAAIKREESTAPRNPEIENTTHFNVYGIPAISLPCGFTPGGLPIGLMIAGPRFSEGRVLALARAYEQATEWHTRKPKLSPDMPVPALATTDEA